MADINDIVSSDDVQRIINLNNALQGTAKQIGAVNAENEKLQKQLDEAAKATNDLTVKSTAYTQILNATEKEQVKINATAKQMQQQQQQLATIEEKLIAQNSKQSIEIQKKNKAYRDAQEVLKQEMILNDENSGKIEKARASNKLLQMQKEKLKETDENYVNTIESLNEKMDQNNKVIADSLNKRQKQTDQVGNYEEAIRNAIKSLNNEATAQKENIKMLELAAKAENASEEERKQATLALNENRVALAKTNTELARYGQNTNEAKIGVGNFRDGFSSLTTQFKNGEIGLKGLATGFFQTAKATLAALWPLGLVAAALGLVYAVFKNFAPLIDKIEQGFAGLTAAWDVLKNSLGQFLSGNQSLKESMGGLGTSMKEAAKDAATLKKAEQDLADMTGGLEVANKKLETQMQSLLLQSKNKTLSEKERTALIDKAIELENQQFENSKKINDEELRISQENIRIKNKLTADQYAKLKELGIDYAEELKDQGVQISDADVDRLKSALLANEDIEQKKISIVEKAMNRKDALEEKAAEASEKAREKALEQEKKTQEEQEKGFKLAADIAEKGTELNKKTLEDQKKDKEEAAKWEEDLLNDSFEKDKAIAEASTEFMLGEAEREYRRKVMLINATSKSEEEAAKKIYELDVQSAQASIDTMNNAMNSINASEEEKWAYKEKIAAAQMDLDEMVAEHEVDTAEKAAEKKKKLQESIYEASMSVANSLFDFMDSKYAGELTALEQKNEAGLLSEKEYAAQKAELELKQAKLTRTRGIFDATINTATAIIKALADPGGIAGIILSVAAGVTGALQIASILSTPLPTMPAFEHGTLNAPETFRAAERNKRELGYLNNGEVVMFEKDGIYSDPKFKGARIVPNAMTEAIMSRTQAPTYNQSSMSDTRIVNELKAVRKSIDNSQKPIIDSRGEIIGTYNRNHREFNRSKRYTPWA